MEPPEMNPGAHWDVDVPRKCLTCHHVDFLSLREAPLRKLLSRKGWAPTEGSRLPYGPA